VIDPIENDEIGPIFQEPKQLIFDGVGLQIPKLKSVDNGEAEGFQGGHVAQVDPDDAIRPRLNEFACGSGNKMGLSDPARADHIDNPSHFYEACQRIRLVVSTDEESEALWGHVYNRVIQCGGGQDHFQLRV
jgi:hypothetical protein